MRHRPEQLRHPFAAAPFCQFGLFFLGEEREDVGLTIDGAVAKEGPDLFDREPFDEFGDAGGVKVVNKRRHAFRIIF